MNKIIEQQLNKLTQYTAADWSWTSGGDPIMSIKQNPTQQKQFGFRFGSNQTKVSGVYTYDPTGNFKTPFCIDDIRSWDNVSVVSFVKAAKLPLNFIKRLGSNSVWSGSRSCYDFRQIASLTSTLKLSDTKSGASYAEMVVKKGPAAID